MWEDNPTIYICAVRYIVQSIYWEPLQGYVSRHLHLRLPEDSTRCRISRSSREGDVFADRGILHFRCHRDFAGLCIPVISTLAWFV